MGDATEPDILLARSSWSRFGIVALAAARTEPPNGFLRPVAAGVSPFVLEGGAGLALEPVAILSVIFGACGGCAALLLVILRIVFFGPGTAFLALSKLLLKKI